MFQQFQSFTSISLIFL